MSEGEEDPQSHPDSSRVKLTDAAPVTLSEQEMGHALRAISRLTAGELDEHAFLEEAGLTPDLWTAFPGGYHDREGVIIFPTYKQYDPDEEDQSGRKTGLGLIVASPIKTWIGRDDIETYVMSQNGRGVRFEYKSDQHAKISGYPRYMWGIGNGGYHRGVLSYSGDQEDFKGRIARNEFYGRVLLAGARGFDPMKSSSNDQNEPIFRDFVEERFPAEFPMAVRNILE